MKFKLIVQLRETTGENDVLNFGYTYSQLVDTSSDLNLLEMFANQSLNMDP